MTLKGIKIMQKHQMLILAALAAVVLSGAPAPSAAVELKVATVSMEHLFDNYHRTRTFNVDLKKRAAALDNKRDQLALEAKTRQRALETIADEAHDRSLSESERERKKREAEEAYTLARNAEEALVEFDRTEKRRFSEEMRVAQQELVKEIRKAIREYATQHGYTLVLDISGKSLNGVETAVYSDPEFDITNPVLEILNKKGK